MLKPIGKDPNDEMIIYILSICEEQKIMHEINKIDFQDIIYDDGIIAHDNDPFLLTQVNLN